MKKYIGFLLIFIMAVNCFAYNNQSNDNDLDIKNKMRIHYEKFRGMSNDTVFCIGQSLIHYFNLFEDEERDYYGITLSEKLLSNAELDQIKKRPNPVGIELRYTHNPSVYRSPVSKSGLDGNWYSATLEWDSKNSKWRINSPMLFTDPSDDKRGEWKIELKIKDNTTKTPFDEESIGNANFRVHKAPTPKFNFTENDTTATLSDAGSYDIDGSYKDLEGNYATDKGIKEWSWSAKVGDVWMDVGKGKTVTFAKNGAAITDYRLTVQDYDGAFASISKTSLILDKPLVDFEYRLGSITGFVSDYLYSGNVGHESLYVNPLITWNDEAWSAALYSTTGTRTEKYTQLKTLQTTANKDAYNLILKNNFNSTLNGNIISTELEAKNRYDLFGLATKSIENIPVDVQDLTGSEGYVNVKGQGHGFMVGESGIFIFKPIINNIKGSLNDLKLTLTSSKPYINQELHYDSNNKIFRLEQSILESKDDPSLWDFFTYKINIFSKRTGEKIHEENGEALIHTPLNLKGYVKEHDNTVEDVEVSTDDPFTISATTFKYAERVTVKLPAIINDANTGEKFNANEEISLTPNSTHTNWSREFIVKSEDMTQDEINISADFTAYAYNFNPRQARGIGYLGDYETDTVGFKLISYKLFDFRVMKVRDLRLEDYYRNFGTGKYDDRAMFVSQMAIDPLSFTPFTIENLTKGYQFTYEIDSQNFNGDADTVVITPSFYAVTGFTRDSQSKPAYWIDSNKKIYKVGEGGHSNYGTITLSQANRTINDHIKATWKGSYFIPGTTFLTNQGTSVNNAKDNMLSSDIIVNFHIVGYKNGVAKFDYNIKQWGLERTVVKNPYIIGDVIRYGQRSNLDDVNIIRNR